MFLKLNLRNEKLEAVRKKSKLVVLELHKVKNSSVAKGSKVF